MTKSYDGVRLVRVNVQEELTVAVCLGTPGVLGEGLADCLCSLYGGEYAR